MLADGAHLSGGKLYILGGQWDRLIVQGLPGQHPALAVVVVLRVEYSEALDEHRLEIELRLDGQPMNAKAVVTFTTGHAPRQGRGTPAFVPAALPFSNLVFETAGRYEWNISVDDEPLGSIPMEVVQASGSLRAPGAMPTSPFQ